VSPHVDSLAHRPADVSVRLDPRPIGQVLREAAKATPDRVALKWLESGQNEELRSLSWAELDRATDDMARRLLMLVRSGDRVAIAATANADWLILEYAAAKAGTPLVPINPAFTDAEIAHILDVSKARALFACAEFRGTALLERLMPLANVRGLGAVHDLARWRELRPGDVPLPDIVSSADAFLVQFTSGTTGRPKGAVLSHRAAYNCAALSMVRLGGARTDNWLNFMPMHHVGGSVSVALAVLSVGATLTLAPRFEPELVLQLIERAGATIMGGVPTMHLALLDHPSFASTNVSSLRIVQIGGSVVATSLIERIEDSLGVIVVNAYGQSEAPNALMTSPDDADLIKAETIGRTLPQRDVKIVDRDGNTLSPGDIGELVMRSPMVMDGYLGVDDETLAQTLTPDGWLHTGDLCSMDESGYVRIHGRVRDVIIRGGENIYPAEVEDVLLRHPDVQDIAVVGIDDERWGEVPVGVYRAAAETPVDHADLERFARAELSSFKVPRRWMRVDAFPMTASGKVKKYALRAELERAGV
jgi:fatty-acyl-CoA synthase